MSFGKASRRIGATRFFLVALTPALCALAGTAYADSLPGSIPFFNVGGGQIFIIDTGGPIAVTDGTPTQGWALVVQDGIIIATAENVTIHATTGPALLWETNAYGLIITGSNLSSADGYGLNLESVNESFFNTDPGPANTIAGISVYASPDTGYVHLLFGADTITDAGNVANAMTVSANQIDLTFDGTNISSAGDAVDLYLTKEQGPVPHGETDIDASSGAITAPNGNAIFLNAPYGTVDVTVGAGETITARNGLALQSLNSVQTNVDSFGVIDATSMAIDTVFAGVPTTPTNFLLTLEDGSSTTGMVRFENDGTNRVNIVAGADIAHATFSGVGTDTGSNIIAFQGTSNATFDTSAASGIDSFEMDGTGTWTLTRSGAAGASAVPLTLSSGTLALASTGVTGAVAIGGAGTLQFGAVDGSYSNTITGTGKIAKAGATTVALTGDNGGFGGETDIGGGTLQIGAGGATGALGGTVSVASGATLSGTGGIGVTTIAGGGTLHPGVGTAPGTLTVQGNLALAATSTYAEQITPLAASLTNVSGTANLGGTFALTVGAGAYQPLEHLTVLTAAGGISGTFSSMTVTGLSSAAVAQLSYDAHDVFLTLLSSISPLLPTDATTNQKNIAGGIDAAIVGGATLSPAFQSLFALSGPALGVALDQSVGRGAPDIGQAASRSFGDFLALAADRGGFADGETVTADIANAPHQAKLVSGVTRLWASAYGGDASLSGDPAIGSAGVSTDSFGIAGGVETALGEDLLAGFSGGYGHENFSAGGTHGGCNDAMLGLYARFTPSDDFYVAASFGYGWHAIDTRRVVTVSGTDVLGGKLDADDLGGRVEAGTRVVLGDRTVARLFVAFQGDRFHAPAYGEVAISGASTFAVSYAARDTDLSRIELGSHIDRAFDVDDGTLVLDGLIGWAHDLSGKPLVAAQFASLPGSGFVLFGTRPAGDTALLGLGVALRNDSGLDIGVKADGQVGGGTGIVTGTANLTYRF
jgi:uncharacterized protein with beta-barrel porin domain